MNQFKGLTAEIVIKKSILFFLYIILLAIGILFFLESGFGTDPISLFIQGLMQVIPLSFGTLTLLNNLTFLFLACLFARKNVFIGTFFGSFTLGPMLSFLEPYFNMVFPGEYSFGIRVLFLLIGIVIESAGIGLAISVRFGIGSTDAIIFGISDLTRIPYKYIKITSDFTFSVVGTLLGGVLGVGTIISVFMLGPLITFFAKLYNKTILKVLNIQDERNEFKMPSKGEGK